MTKTYNEKYGKRGDRHVHRVQSRVGGRGRPRRQGKGGLPVPVLGGVGHAGRRHMAGMGVRYRQLQGATGKTNGGSRTSSFGQLRKRTRKPDVSTRQGRMITVSAPKCSRIPAVGAGGLRLHDGGEWTGKKCRVKRGFVKLYVMANPQPTKIVVLPATVGSAGGAGRFRALPERGMVTVGGADGGAGEAIQHSKDPGPDAPPGSWTAAPHPAVIPDTRIASRRVSRPAHRSSRTPRGIIGQRSVSSVVMPRTALRGRRGRVRACGCGPGHPAQDQHDGARQGIRRFAWHIGKGPSGREPRATRPDLPGRKERRENRTWETGASRPTRPAAVSRTAMPSGTAAGGRSSTPSPTR